MAKGDKPCLSKVCIGDKLASLGHIDWLPAKTDFQGFDVATFDPRESSINDNLKRFAPDNKDKAKALINYIVADKVDNNSFKGLSELKGFCRTGTSILGLSGKFKSKSGHVTTVYFKIFSGESPEDQFYKVVRIIRVIEGNYSAAQWKELGERLAEQYGQYQLIDQYSPSREKPSWRFRAPKFELQEALNESRPDPKKLWQYPGCSTSLSLD